MIKKTKQNKQNNIDFVRETRNTFFKRLIQYLTKYVFQILIICTFIR